jgi:lipoprotein-releasing system ATP-binding protein
MNKLSVQNLYKTYFDGESKTSVLNGLTFDALGSKLTAVIGESGSGKTTLLNLISTIDKPTKGEIIFNNTCINNSHNSEPFHHYGFVFQFHYLLNTLTVAENILIAAEIINQSKQDAVNRMHNFAEQLGIVHKMNSYPFQLSGGERQRAAFIRAIINKPSLVLMDEPTGNLDQENSKILQELIISIMHEQDSIFIVATHDKDFADRADQIIAL